MTMWFPMNVMKFVDYGHWEEVYNGNCMRCLIMLFLGRQFECIGNLNAECWVRCPSQLVFYCIGNLHTESIGNLHAECWVRCPSQPVSYCIGNFHAECISNLNAECWVSMSISACVLLHIYFMCWMGRFPSISACGIWDAECSNRHLHYSSSWYVYYIRVYKDECENVAYSVPSFYNVYCIWFLLCWMRNHYLPNTHLEVEVDSA